MTVSSWFFGSSRREWVSSYPERALDLVDLFSGLTQQERKTLAGKTTHRHYDAGEAWVEPGKVLTSLFVVGSGVLSFTSVGAEGDSEILRIGPGDYFAEIGMLTGRPAETTASALAPVTIYELSKKDLSRCSRRGPKFHMKCAGRWPRAKPQAVCSPRPRSTRACRRAGSRPGSPTACIGCSTSWPPSDRATPCAPFLADAGQVHRPRLATYTRAAAR